MQLFPNDGCLCRQCVMVSCTDGRWLTLVRLNQLSRDSSGEGQFAIGSGVYLCLPLFFLSFFFSSIRMWGITCHIFLFCIPSPSFPLSLLFFPLVSVCTHTLGSTIYYGDCVLRLWPEKSPPLPALYAVALLMVFLMAADGRREPLALGPGVQRSFNKSQSVLCHYINIFGQLL